MRSVEQIKADITKVEGIMGKNENYTKQYDNELRLALTSGVPISDLETLCAAYKDGRCVMLPCKVGDKIYEPYERGMIDDATVNKIEIDVCSNMGVYSISEFGKTVFLTRPEAEAALKGGTEG